jgi:2-methylcitrate dehydratase PrpD
MNAHSFLSETSWSGLPGEVRRHVGWLLLDLYAVMVAGRPAPAARIAADYASVAHGGDAATSLLDGRRFSAPGAALANGVLANVLDNDDGHRLTKGHPGAVVIPAALAVAEASGASFEEFLTAVVVGYEIAIRAGIRQHARWPMYHGSGSWGAVGAAAAAARLLRLDASQFAHAIGLAEYHGPMALIMRTVAEPAMIKDGIGWGAMTGVSGAMLAQRGFTATSSEFLAAKPLDDLGQQFELMDLYVKPYPCCRWTQPAIEAAKAVRLLVGAAEITAVTIRTFAAAAELARQRPRDTEEAQYNLVWPVAVTLAHGDFGIAQALGARVPGEFCDDPVAAALMDRIGVEVAPEFTAEFPGRRLSEVMVTLADGRQLRSGSVEAAGDPGDDRWEQVVRDKVAAILRRPCPRDLNVEPPRDALGGTGLARLESLLSYPLTKETP